MHKILFPPIHNTVELMVFGVIHMQLLLIMRSHRTLSSNHRDTFVFFNKFYDVFVMECINFNTKFIFI